MQLLKMDIYSHGSEDPNPSFLKVDTIKLSTYADTYSFVNLISCGKMKLHQREKNNEHFFQSGFFCSQSTLSLNLKL